jgi:hypothetical protein
MPLFGKTASRINIENQISEAYPKLELTIDHDNLLEGVKYVRWPLRHMSYRHEGTNWVILVGRRVDGICIIVCLRRVAVKTFKPHWPEHHLTFVPFKGGLTNKCMSTACPAHAQWVAATYCVVRNKRWLQDVVAS